MALVLIAILGVLLIGIVWLIAIYNRFVGVRQHMKESWSDVDVELKRRYDLIPNLVNTVKGYAEHERAIFEQVSELRSKAMTAASGGARSDVESELGRAITRLVAVAERYPALKADANFLELQRELALTEDRIAAARRFYNANVREMNVLCSTFPTNMVAGMFAFSEERFFELDDAAERSAPQVA